MHIENSFSEGSVFLTLTYNDENLPINEFGEPTLVKKDWQDFMKRLRFHFSDLRLRFFSVGEYGSTYGRPHYHAIIFNLPFSKDLDSVISRIWNKGFVKVGDVNPKSIRYVAGYMEKINPKKYENRENEFRLMSRKPAIGSQILGFSPEMLGINDLSPDVPVVISFRGMLVNVGRVLRSKLRERFFVPEYIRWLSNEILYNLRKGFVELIQKYQPDFKPSFLRGNYFPFYYEYDFIQCYNKENSGYWNELLARFKFKRNNIIF